MKNNVKQNFLEELYKTIQHRSKSKSKNSYTRKLLKKGKKKISQKFGEESLELIVDYLNGSKKRTIEEVSDLLYHVIVLLSSKNIKPKEVEKELRNRLKEKKQ